MAEIEIAPLAERWSEQELAELTRVLAKAGAEALPEPEDDLTVDVADGHNEDALQEVLDRLDEHDALADVFVPVDFEGKLEVSRHRVGSLSSLLEALAVVKEELALDDEDEEDGDRDDDDGDGDRALLGAGQLRRALAGLQEAAKTAHDKLLSLHISY